MQKYLLFSDSNQLVGSMLVRQLNYGESPDTLKLSYFFTPCGDGKIRNSSRVSLVWSVDPSDIVKKLFLHCKNSRLSPVGGVLLQKKPIFTSCKNSRDSPRPGEKHIKPDFFRVDLVQKILLYWRRSSIMIKMVMVYVTLILKRRIQI